VRHVLIEHLTPHTDSRGLVVEPLSPGELPAQRNVHLVVTRPGAVRGNHYHQRGTEITLVVGPARVRIREGAVVRDTEVPSGAAYRFTIPPGVAHAYAATGPGPMILIGFNSDPHDPRSPDVVPDVLFDAGDLRLTSAPDPLL
jgi:dTDP-4-dehydrorhamnose 3,5-epimerase-like enzyme